MLPLNDAFPEAFIGLAIGFAINFLVGWLVLLVMLSRTPDPNPGAGRAAVLASLCALLRLGIDFIILMVYVTGLATEALPTSVTLIPALFLQGMLLQHLTKGQDGETMSFTKANLVSLAIVLLGLAIKLPLAIWALDGL